MSAALKIDEHIIKIVGVFSYNTKKDIVRFRESGFDSMKIVDLPSDQVIANLIENKKIKTKSRFGSNENCLQSQT